MYFYVKKKKNKGRKNEINQSIFALWKVLILFIPFFNVSMLCVLYKRS